MTSITSLSALQEAARALPPVPPGKVRVYRGQVKNYGSITPAAFRNRLELMAVWNVYTRFLLMDITGANSIPINEGELQVWNLWLDALAQHYASGSRYLDVSYSIESAAWFALHKGVGTPRRGVLGLPGPPSLYDLPGEVSWVDYHTATEGWVFAFDVDVWDGTSANPPDLALIDLSKAPEPFRTPRMLAQRGCLIRTGNADNYDLQCHRVEKTPLHIAWPLSGSAFAQREVEEMFPLPTVDPWYRRFLGVPMMPDVDKGTGELVLKRPLPVTLYRGATEAYNGVLEGTEKFLAPVLLHQSLRQTGVENAPADNAWWKALRVQDATPIVLEAPLLHVFPSADSGLWNHELLLRDISGAVATRSAPKELDGKEASLRNVLFQFSPFEEVFWERARQLEVSTELTRGVWLARHGEEIVATLLHQKFPAPHVESGPTMLIRLDPAKRRMITKVGDYGDGWTDLADEPQLAKPVFVALHMLRALSPTWKVEATPRKSRLSGEPSAIHPNLYLTAIIEDDAQLMRLHDPAGLADWFVIHDEDGEPYTSRPPRRCKTFEDVRPFADIPASVFQEALLAGFPPEKS